MTNDEAKSILQAWSHESGGEPTEPVLEALKLTETDGPLAKWWKQEQQLDQSISSALQSSPVPSQLREQIIASIPEQQAPVKRKVIAFPQLLPIAASLIAVLFIGVLLFDPLSAEAEPEFDDYLGHISDYQMDPDKAYKTHDSQIVLSQLQKHLGAAPARLPVRLKELRPMAVHCSDWRGTVVGMIMLENSNGDKLTLYLVKSASFPDRQMHPVKPKMEEVQKETYMVWSETPFLYTLTGPQLTQFVNE